MNTGKAGANWHFLICCIKNTHPSNDNIMKGIMLLYGNYVVCIYIMKYARDIITWAWHDLKDNACPKYTIVHTKKKKRFEKRKNTLTQNCIPPPTYTEPRRPVYEMIYDSKFVTSYIDETNPLPLNLGFYKILIFILLKKIESRIHWFVFVNFFYLYFDVFFLSLPIIFTWKWGRFFPLSHRLF